MTNAQMTNDETNALRIVTVRAEPRMYIRGFSSCFAHSNFVIRH